MFGVLFVVSVITFFLMHQIPGGPFAREQMLPETIVENLTKKYNLDQPIWLQYVNYMADLVVPTVTTEEQKFDVTNDYLLNLKLPTGDNDYVRWINFGPSFSSRTRSERRTAR